MQGYQEIINNQNLKTEKCCRKASSPIVTHLKSLLIGNLDSECKVTICHLLYQLPNWFKIPKV